MSGGVQHLRLPSCATTQEEVRQRLRRAEAGACIAVSTGSQLQGRGREGRTWHDPPGAALLVSVGRRGPLPVGLLADLPRRVVDAVLAAIGRGAPHAGGVVVWKAPNDLVARDGGAKVGGVLVDARTTGDRVDEVVVGIGVNVAGVGFTTDDGRAAATLAQLTGTDLDLGELLDDVVARVARELAPRAVSPG